MGISKNMFEQEYESWLEGYMSVFEPEKRLAYLKRGLEEEPGEVQGHRKELFDYRYCNRPGRLTGSDRFLGLWLELKDQLRISEQLMGRKRAEKNIRRLADDFLLTQNLPDWKSELLEAEYRHMILYYISLCQNDRSYNSLFLGFVNMKDQTLEKKLVSDLRLTAVEIPKIAKMERVFAPFKKIIDDIV